MSASSASCSFYLAAAKGRSRFLPKEAPRLELWPDNGLPTTHQSFPLTALISARRLLTCHPAMGLDRDDLAIAGRISVVGTVAQKKIDGAINLIQQGRQRGGLPNAISGQIGADDLTAAGFRCIQPCLSCDASALGSSHGDQR